MTNLIRILLFSLTFCYGVLSQPCYEFPAGKCYHNSPGKIKCLIRDTGNKTTYIRDILIKDSLLVKGDSINLKNIKGYQRRIIARYSACNVPNAGIAIYSALENRCHFFTANDFVVGLKLTENKDYKTINLSGRWFRDTTFIVLAYQENNPYSLFLLQWFKSDKDFKRIKKYLISTRFNPTSDLETYVYKDKVYIAIAKENYIYVFDGKNINKEPVPKQTGNFIGSLILMPDKTGYLFRKNNKYFLVVKDNNAVKIYGPSKYEIITFYKNYYVVNKDGKLCLVKQK